MENFQSSIHYIQYSEPYFKVRKNVESSDHKNSLRFNFMLTPAMDLKNWCIVLHVRSFCKNEKTEYNKTFYFETNSEKSLQKLNREEMDNFVNMIVNIVTFCIRDLNSSVLDLTHLENEKGCIAPYDEAVIKLMCESILNRYDILSH